MPASVRASSVERSSFDRSGRLQGQVRLRLSALAGLGTVNTTVAARGPVSGNSPPWSAIALTAASTTACRQDFTRSWLDSITATRPVGAPPLPRTAKARLEPCGAGWPWTVIRNGFMVLLERRVIRQWRRGGHGKGACSGGGAQRAFVNG